MFPRVKAGLNFVITHHMVDYPSNPCQMKNISTQTHRPSQTLCGCPSWRAPCDGQVTSSQPCSRQASELHGWESRSAGSPAGKVTGVVGCAECAKKTVWIGEVSFTLLPVSQTFTLCLLYAEINDLGLRCSALACTGLPTRMGETSELLIILTLILSFLVFIFGGCSMTLVICLYSCTFFSLSCCVYTQCTWNKCSIIF